MMDIMAAGNAMQPFSREMRSSSPGDHIKGGNDDVVHCICRDDIDEGFMIQVCTNTHRKSLLVAVCRCTSMYTNEPICS